MTIVAAVTLGLFATVALAVWLVERQIDRSRRQAAGWAVLAQRLQAPMAAFSSSLMAVGVTFAEAARAAVDFERALQRAQEVFRDDRR